MRGGRLVVRIEKRFVVRAPIDRVWEYVLDVERLAQCLSFAGRVQLLHTDDVAHHIRLFAEGREQRGKGTASVTVDSWLEGVAEGTRVFLEAHVTIAGPGAQYAQETVQEVSNHLTQQFAKCLEASMPVKPTEPAEATTIRLWKACWR